MFDSAITQGCWSGIVEGLYESELHILHPDALKMLKNKTFNDDDLSPKELGIRDGLLSVGVLTKKNSYLWFIPLGYDYVINPNFKGYNNVEA